MRKRMLTFFLLRLPLPFPPPPPLPPPPPSLHRTGFIICCYLLYSGLFPSLDPNLALRFYAIKRTKNQKGVTVSDAEVAGEEGGCAAAAEGEVRGGRMNARDSDD